MKKNILIIAIFTLIAFVSSCTEKEPINNTGSVLFWYNQQTSQALIADQANSLTFKVNGEIIGSTGTNVYWISEPACAQNGSITGKINLGTKDVDTVPYSISDQTGHVYWSGTLGVSSGDCKKFQLQL